MHDPRARFNRYNRSRLLLTLHFEILKRFSLRLLRSWRSQTTFHFSHFICSFICSQLQLTVLQGKQLGSPGVASGKESTLPMQEMQETRVPSLDGKDPPKKGMATYSSVLAWEIPRTEEPGGLQSMGLQRVGDNWVTFTFNNITIQENFRVSNSATIYEQFIF